MAYLGPGDRAHRTNVHGSRRVRGRASLRHPVVTGACAALGLVAILSGVSVSATPAQDVRVDPRLTLLTVQQSDLPAGWADNTDNVGVTAGDAQEFCGLTFPEPIAKAYSVFNDEAAGSVSSLAAILPKGAAKTYVDRMIRLIRPGCVQSFDTGVEGDSPIKARLGWFAVPKLGDQALGVHLAPRSLPFATDAVVIRRGDTVLFVLSGRIGAKPLPVLPLARRLAARLAALPNS